MSVSLWPPTDSFTKSFAESYLIFEEKKEQIDLCVNISQAYELFASWIQLAAADSLQLPRIDADRQLKCLAKFSHC